MQDLGRPSAKITSFQKHNKPSLFEMLSDRCRRHRVCCTSCLYKRRMRSMRRGIRKTDFGKIGNKQTKNGKPKPKRVQTSLKASLTQTSGLSPQLKNSDKLQDSQQTPASERYPSPSPSEDLPPSPKPLNLKRFSDDDTGPVRRIRRKVRQVLKRPRKTPSAARESKRKQRAVAVKQTSQVPNKILLVPSEPKHSASIAVVKPAPKVSKKAAPVPSESKPKQRASIAVVKQTPRVIPMPKEESTISKGLKRPRPVDSESVEKFSAPVNSKRRKQESSEDHFDCEKEARRCSNIPPPRRSQRLDPGYVKTESERGFDCKQLKYIAQRKS